MDSPFSDPLLERRELSLDSALTAVGEFGAGTRLQLFVAGLGWAVASFQTLLVVFAGLDPVSPLNIRCLKEDKACLAELAKPRPDLCGLPEGTWEWSHRGSSIASEWDLICGQAWLLQLVNVCFFGGMLLGCVLTQLSSERFGRKRLLYAATVISAVAGIMSATAPSFWLYMLFRCLTGAAVGGLGMAAFALATDTIGPSWRAFGGLLLQIFFSLGACLATLLAWVAPGWRVLTLLSALAALAYLASWSFLQESPRWLLLRGRKGEATATLAALAFGNRTRLPEFPLADPTAFLSNSQNRVQDMMAHPKLRPSLLLSGIGWFAAGLSYYGVLLLSEGLSSREAGPARAGEGSVFVTVLTGFSYEVPGVAAAGLAAERIGRKATLAGSFLQAGGLLIAAALTRANAQRALAVAARFGLAAAYATLFLQSSELYPSVVRAQGMAVGNYCARIGAMLSPGLALLEGLHVGGRPNLLPLVVAGGVCIVAGVVSIFLPETLGNPPPETIQELNGSNLRRPRSWAIALRQLFRSKSSSKSGGRGESGETLVLRSA